MSQPPHRIRLHGPWQARSRQDPEWNESVRLPVRLAEIVQRATRTVELRRSFGRPTNLDPHEQVWLIVAQQGTTFLRCNSLAIENPAERIEVDVTGILADRNELELVVDSTAIVESVLLEIRSTGTPRVRQAE